MPALLAFVFGEFGVRAFRIEAPGDAPASTVLGAFLDADPCPSTPGSTAADTPPSSLSHLPSPRPSRHLTVADCRPYGTAGTSPQPDDTWQSWCSSCTAVLVGEQPTSLGLHLAGTSQSRHSTVLEVSAGPDSGFASLLPPGSWTLGRTLEAELPIADPFLSRSPVEVTHGPRGLDLSSTDDRVPHVALSRYSGHAMTIGCTRLTVLPPGPTVTCEPLDLDWPAPPRVRPPEKPSWIFSLLPFVLGIILVAVTGMWWFIILALSGPVTAVLRWWIERRRHHRESRTAVTDYRRSLVGFLGEMSACIDESRSAHSIAPPARGCIVLGYGPALSPVAIRGHPTFDGLRGAFAIDGSVPLTGTDGPRASAELAREVPLDARPPDGSTDVPPGIGRLLRRSGIAGHVFEGVLYPAVDDSVVIFGPSSADLDIVGTSPVVLDVVRVIIADALAVDHPVQVHGAEVGRIMPELAAVGPVIRTEATAVPDLDSTCAATSPATDIRGDGRNGVPSAPVGRTAAAPIVISLSGGTHAVTAEIRCPAGSPTSTAARPSGDEESNRPRWRLVCRDADSSGELFIDRIQRPGRHPVPTSGAIVLRRLRSERFLQVVTPRRPPEGAAPLPRSLSDLVDIPVGARTSEGGLGPDLWPGRRTQRPGTVRVPLGSTGVGTLHVDLVEHGPHALVAGTTGSGKSVLLHTWVTSLALALSPDEVRFVLIDFKGGATFAPFAGLAHVDSLVHNLDPSMAMRALRSLRAEVLHREGILAARGAADIDELSSEASGGTPALPRIIVVIDEFQALIEDNPEGTAMIESFTALGRSLGIHFILATQRPAGVVTARMRANINLRIALRVRDVPDSIEVIGTEAAAHLPPGDPGAAYLSRGGAPELFRAALVDSDAPRAPAKSPVLTWSSIADERSGTVHLPQSSARAGARVTVPGLIAAAQQFLRASPYPAPPQVVSPPLPDHVPSLSPIHLGTIDRPDEKRTVEWEWNPVCDGCVIVTGGRGSGMSSAVHTLGSAAAAAGADVVHLGPMPHRADPPARAPGFSPASLGDARSDASPAAASPREPCADHESRAHSDSDRARGSFVSIAHQDTWALEHLLGALENRVGSDPLVVCIDDYDALRSSIEGTRRLSRLEAVLAHATGSPESPLTFVIAAGRRILHSPLAARARTRLIFPPAEASEATHLGLSARRFAGRWPPGRAVLLGPATTSAGTQGADIQLVDVADPASAPERPIPLSIDEQTFGSPQLTPPTWILPAADAPGPGPTGVEIGTGPGGEPVVWSPDLHGPVLTVRGTPDGTPVLVEAIADAWDRSTRRDEPLSAIAAAHHADPELVARALTSEACAVGFPLHHSPGYSSPLARAPGLGPTLVIGARTAGELAENGLRELPLVPGPRTRGWFVTAERAIPVDVAPLLARTDSGDDHGAPPPS